MPKSASSNRGPEPGSAEAKAQKSSPIVAAVSIAACALFLIIFFALALGASKDKSPTADEPLHLVGAWTENHEGDFRVNPEDPPLWKMWAVAGTRSADMKINRQSPLWDAMLHREARFDFVMQTLFEPGTNASEIVGDARLRMTFIGVALGAVIAWWAWRLAGPISAVAAVAMFSLDPNFLAHSPLVKNDVAMTLAFLVFAAALWLVGENATVLRSTALVWLTAVAFVVKFSAVLAIPMLAIAMLVRVLLPAPWPFLQWTAKTRLQRLGAASVLCLLCAGATYFTIWGCYSFRFSPGDTSDLFNQQASMNQIAMFEAARAHGAPEIYTQEEFAQWVADQKPELADKLYQWADDHKILPEAWLRGFYYTWGRGLVRDCYLCGENSHTGWWYYFPLAIAFKTPLATLIALAIGLAIWLRYSHSSNVWTMCAIMICPVLYGSAAVWEDLNLGLRHIFPVYPFLFIFLGVVFAQAWRRRPKLAGAIASLVLIGLAAETFLAYPNFIPFFNVAAGGSRGGLALLGDSNLDWGQDLPALAQWQKSHPETEVYLRFFGPANPNYYGLKYVYLNGDARITHPSQVSAEPKQKVLALSATFLQGIYLSPSQREKFARFRKQKPIAVLNGSIYLFNDVDEWLRQMQADRSSPSEPAATG